MVSIVDYGMGNLRSVKNALEFLGIPCRMAVKACDIESSHKLILPGVGSFRRAMENIAQRGILDALRAAVLEKRMPILGICLGMQLFADQGEEDGLTDGFGWIPGVVKRFPEDRLSIKIPHVGFNTVYLERSDNDLFKGLGKEKDFYFIHSYRLICKDAHLVTSWTKYGEHFVSSVQKGNIFGVQFHPEKSQNNGLMLLKNFCDYKY